MPPATELLKEDLFCNIAKAPNISAGGTAVTLAWPGSSVPNLGGQGPGKQGSRSAGCRVLEPAEELDCGTGF